MTDKRDPEKLGTLLLSLRGTIDLDIPLTKLMESLPPEQFQVPDYDGGTLGTVEETQESYRLDLLKGADEGDLESARLLLKLFGVQHSTLTSFEDERDVKSASEQAKETKVRAWAFQETGDVDLFDPKTTKRG